MNHNGNATEITLPEKVFWYVENGRSYGQTAEVLSMPKATVYKVYQKERKRRETFKETAVNDSETARNEQAEKVNVAPEKPFTPVSEPFTAFGKNRGTVAKTGLMYAVFFTTVATGCYAFVNTLPAVVGISLAVIYVLYSTDCILTAGDATDPEEAKRARNLIIAIEAVAAVADCVVFNRYLWKHVENLPFPVYRGTKVNWTRMENLELKAEAVWVNGDWVGLVAVLLGGMMFLAAYGSVYAIWKRTKSITIKK